MCFPMFFPFVTRCGGAVSGRLRSQRFIGAESGWFFLVECFFCRRREYFPLRGPLVSGMRIRHRCDRLTTFRVVKVSLHGGGSLLSLFMCDRLPQRPLVGISLRLPPSIPYPANVPSRTPIVFSGHKPTPTLRPSRLRPSANTQRLPPG